MVSVISPDGVVPNVAPVPADPLRQQVLGVIVALCFFVFLLYLAGRGRFNLRYFVLWFCMAGIAFVLAVFPRIMYVFAAMIGIAVPLNAVFFAGFFFVALQLVQLTVSITDLEEQNKALCQQLALARAKVADIEAHSAHDRTEQRG